MAKEGKQTEIKLFSPEQVDPYGAVIGKYVSKTVDRFPIDIIRPDPDQPRRLLPDDLVDAVGKGVMKPLDAFNEWQKRVESGTDEAAAQEMRELERLATSIEQYGLINPITIRESGIKDNSFIIVTGERRYWAHMMLIAGRKKIKEGGGYQKPNEIKASIIPQGVVVRAHQIVENIMREDINVVEKAHGLWSLRYELSNDAYRRHTEDQGVRNKNLVTWQTLEESLGMSRQYRLRIISVLKLSPEAQQLIERHNLAEATIRPVVDKLKEHPDLQLQALNQLIAWQEAEEGDRNEGRRIVPSMKALVNEYLAERGTPKPRKVYRAGLDFLKFRQTVRGTLRYLQKLDDSAKTDLSRVATEADTGAEIVGELQALRNQIDAILATIREE